MRLDSGDGKTKEHISSMSKKYQLSSWGIRKHGKAFLDLGLVSIIGILASVGFQVVTSRSLGPEAFGLLAAFMAIVSIAATGSSALQSSVAVGSARAVFNQNAGNDFKINKWDASLVEAILLGGFGTVIALFFANPLAKLLNTGIEAVLIAAATILPAFLISRALGILQGSGKSLSVVGWTSFGQALRLALVFIVISLSLGAISMLFAVFLSTLFVSIGSGIQSSRSKVKPIGIVFSRDTIVVLLLVITFSWLTNIEVVLVRGGTTELVSGSFAAAAVLTKTLFIVPGMMSVYLLPLFVSSQNDRKTSNKGLVITLGIIFMGGSLAFLGLLLFAKPITFLFFGEGYDLTITFLPWLALAYLPWAMSQGLLIRHTAIASRPALAVLLFTSIIEWLGAQLVLPNINGMIWLIGLLGILVFVCLILIHIYSLELQNFNKESSNGN